MLFLCSAVAEGFLQLFHLVENRVGILQKHLSVGSDLHAPCGTLKDGGSERCLQFSYGAAQIRLIDVQLLGRFVDGAGSGHLNSVFQI